MGPREEATPVECTVANRYQMLTAVRGKMDLMRERADVGLRREHARAPCLEADQKNPGFASCPTRKSIFVRNTTDHCGQQRKSILDTQNSLRKCPVCEGSENNTLWLSSGSFKSFEAQNQREHDGLNCPFARSSSPYSSWHPAFVMLQRSVRHSRTVMILSHSTSGAPCLAPTTSQHAWFMGRGRLFVGGKFVILLVPQNYLPAPII